MWVSGIPKIINAGSTIKWRDEATTVPIDQQVTSTDWTLTYYLRSAEAGALTVVSSAYNTGFETTISATASSELGEGVWFFEAIATKGSEVHSLTTGKITVKQTLSYTGTAGKIDPRTPNQIERDNIQAALRKFNDGAQEYSIGNRTYKRVSMNDLRTRLHDLIPICLREEKAEKLSQGLGTGLRLNVRIIGS